LFAVAHLCRLSLSQLRNRQLGIKARAGSLSEFLEEGEHSDRDERSFDELAEDGDVGAIKEQFGSRSARNRRKKRQMADRQEAELERRLERAKRSHEEDAAVGGDDLGVDDGATPSAAAATTTATTTAGTSRIVPIADVIAAEAAAGPKRKAPVIAATDDDD
jgi:predicted phosphoribosyltransferase